LLVGFLACTNDNDLKSVVENSTILKKGSGEAIEYPFADSLALKSFSKEKDIVDYEFARKLTLLELKECGFEENMNWTGCTLSKLPIVFFDFKSTPRFYDFIVYDAESKPIGKVTAYAQKKASTVIKSVSSEIPSYSETLTKFGNDNYQFFTDWMGNQYVGEVGKTNAKPNKVFNIITKSLMPQAELSELDDREILDYVGNEVLPQLVAKPQDDAFRNVPEALLADDEIRDEIEISKNFTVEQMKDSMETALVKMEKEAQIYWNTLTEQEQEILNTSDAEISNPDSKFLGRFFRRIFSGVDTSPHWIDKYENTPRFNPTNNGTLWCGPWVASYILYANQNVDKYMFFEGCAATYGELGIGNILLKLFGKPLTPVEMSWSMPIASGGKIWINPMLMFADLCAYDQIKHYKKPALRLCAISGSLHWTLAYATKQTGNWLWRNYYFVQRDNGTLVGKSNTIHNDSHYTCVDWWNPWLMVWD